MVKWSLNSTKVEINRLKYQCRKRRGLFRKRENWGESNGHNGSGELEEFPTEVTIPSNLHQSTTAQHQLMLHFTHLQLLQFRSQALCLLCRTVQLLSRLLRRLQLQEKPQPHHATAKASKGRRRVCFFGTPTSWQRGCKPSSLSSSSSWSWDCRKRTTRRAAGFASSFGKSNNLSLHATPHILQFLRMMGYASEAEGRNSWKLLEK